MVPAWGHHRHLAVARPRRRCQRRWRARSHVAVAAAHLPAVSRTAHARRAQLRSPMANFQYNPPFPAVVPGDVSKFTRTFEHRDWVDGQDLVQAGATPDEQGMNARLNALELDLEAVRADLIQSFKLISDLRKALAAALGQVQGE